jgi:uncharacterized protein
MKGDLKNKLIKIAQERQVKDDPSHDFQHIIRVLNLAEKIGRSVKADQDIIIPAALFHDTIVYRKDMPQSRNESNESADIVGEILSNISEYPQDKIKSVQTCIRQCSFSKGIIPELPESKVLQDADRLEATGAISIMRTFASSGQMGRQFYDPLDPFCKKGTVKFRSAIDLFYDRLLIVEKTMHTKLAKKMAKKRTMFLKKFLAQLKNELIESGIGIIDG